MIPRIIICACVMVVIATAAYAPPPPETKPEPPKDAPKGVARPPHFPFGGYGYPYFGGYHGYGAAGYNYWYPHHYNAWYNPWHGAAPFYNPYLFGRHAGYHHPAPFGAHALAFTFVGRFKGTCEGFPDGLYYVDGRSFAYCSNGIKTIQACADGSSNPTFDDFKAGKYKAYHDFCSVNNDVGY